MIGEHQVDTDTMEENKKRNASLAGLDRSSAKSVIVSPPSKKLKQCRLPFQLLTQSPTNHKPVAQNDQETNKRKRVVSGSSIESSPLNRTKTSENKPKITPVKKIKTISKSTSDTEVSSTSEDTTLSSPVVVLEADSSSQTPKHAMLDQFFYKTQQPEVSTSDGEDVSERSYAKPNVFESVEKKCTVQDQIEVIDLCFDEIMKKKPETTKAESPQDSPDTSVPKTPTTAGRKSSSDDDSIIITDTPKRPKVSIISPKQVDDNAKPSNPNRSGEVNLVTTPVRVISGATPVRTLSTPVLPGKTPEVKEKTTPITKGKTPNKTPKSAKALQKEAERKKKQEEKEKLIMEKKQKLEEERAEKQRVKDEAKAAKEKERLEAKRLKDLEKEKKEQERQEKKQKEEEAKQEIIRKKEEEKKKKQEILDAKLEDKRKKEEEKQKQEDEEKRINEEKKLKQQKKEKAFMNFFTKAPEPAITKEKSTPDSVCGPFAAFELKEGMTLAPRVRRVMEEEKKKELAKYISNQNASASYLKDIKSTMFKPGKDVKTPCDSDIPVIAEGKELVKCKFLKFHGNHRPAYYGTMRKTSGKIRARNPFAMDEVLDYEVDSDEEWEEPGESLSNSEGEDDPASDDDEDDDGFFVPHGYLSEDEGGNECDDGIKKMKEKQAAKAQAWEAGLKKKIETLTPVLIGPIWAGDDNDNQSRQWKILQQYAAIVLVNTPIQTSFSKTSSMDKQQSATGCDDDDKKTLKKKGVPKEAIPDLIRLVHGNTAGIQVLSRTFREFWDKKQPNIAEGDANVDASPASNATCHDLVGIPSRPNTPEADFRIPVRQMKLKINKIAVRERRNGYDRDCWYVHEELLKKHNLMDLPVPNVSVKEKKAKNADICSPVTTPKVNQIAQFAKKLSPEAYQKQTQQNLAVLKERQEQERIKKEQEKALQLKLQQERIEKYRQEQQKAAQIRMEQESALRLKMQQDAQWKAAQYAATNHFTPLVQSIQACQPKIVLTPLPSLYALNPNQSVKLKPSPPKKTAASVLQLLAKKKQLNVLKSTIVHSSTDKESVPQKMDCGYSADCEGQGV